MPRGETHACEDCGAAFGSRVALSDHARRCPVRQDVELRRVQENLEWRRLRIERWIAESYRSAARAFSAYHTQATEHARLLHRWIADDFQSSVRDLEDLSEAVNAASKVHFPRMNKLRADVGLLLEQAQDLTAILATLNRDYGVRT